MTLKAKEKMDITLIPGIMRKKSWLNGARLMEIWFSRAANSNPESGIPEISTIKMNAWALKFQRCSQVYLKLLREKAWRSKKLIHLLSKQRKLKSGQNCTFGNLNRSVSMLEKESVYWESVGGLIDPLDDMYAALGRFAIEVVVTGEVFSLKSGTAPNIPLRIPGGISSSITRPSGMTSQAMVSINKVGFFISDTYDFNGDQPLGFWNKSDVKRVPPSTKQVVIDGYEYISNKSYRDWRKKNNKGGDFKIYSDLKIVNLNPPDKFPIPVHV